MLMIQRRNVYWVTKLKNQVRKTWGVTYVLLIMEEELSIKMFKLRHKSHFYHLGRGGVGGGRGKGRSILVVIKSRISQFSLVTPLNSLSDDWSYLRSLWKPGDSPPPPPARPAHPSTPLSKRKMVTYSLLLVSAFQRMKSLWSLPFPFNFSIFLIWDWRMLSKAI